MSARLTRIANCTLDQAIAISFHSIWGPLDLNLFFPRIWPNFRSSSFENWYEFLFVDPNLSFSLVILDHHLFAAIKRELSSLCNKCLAVTICEQGHHYLANKASLSLSWDPNCNVRLQFGPETRIDRAGLSVCSFVHLLGRFQTQHHQV